MKNLLEQQIELAKKASAFHLHDMGSWSILPRAGLAVCNCRKCGMEVVVREGVPISGQAIDLDCC